MNWRFRLVLLLFIVCLLAILARLFYWQTARAEELVNLGEDQYGYRMKLTPTRGEIRTADGFAIAANSLSYLVYANPKEIKNKDQTAQLLSPLLQTDSATISALLSIDKFWVALKNQVTPDKKAAIEKLQIPGVGFEEQELRYYPEASTAAKLLGFVGKDDQGNQQGYSGLEGYYDKQLRGKEGYVSQIHDAFGNPIIAQMNTQESAIDGRDLNLYLDRTIQFMLEKELKDGLEKYGADSDMAAVIDPKTGGILAMAAYPSYDPAHYADYTDDLYRNPFISDTYEPGSTFKPLIMAGALDSGLITPDTHCPKCSGPVSVGGYDIHTWDDKYRPNETMTKILEQSDNVGMVYISELLGHQRELSYINQFGIGQMTGIDLQGEVAPNLRPQNQWYPIDYATASFGQGISVTPIELLSAFTAIANNGKRMEPHVVKSVETPEGETIQIPPKVVDQPISEKTAKVMTEMMVDAVDNGESKWTKLDGYRIAGKTGTAQIPIAGHYDPNKTIASFIGFGPAENPRFLMLVIVDKPTTSIYGAETAAPIFFDIAKDILNYYGIPPTE